VGKKDTACGTKTDTADIRTEASIIITIVRLPLLVNCAANAVITATSMSGTTAKIYERRFAGSLDIISLKLPPKKLATKDAAKVASRRNNILIPIDSSFEIYILYLVMGLTIDIIIELSDNSPENKSLVNKITNNGNINDDIKFNTVTGRNEFLKRETPKLLPVTKLTTDAATAESIAIDNKNANFFLLKIL
jgi:hypothetical protein